MKSKKHLFLALDKFFKTDKYTKGQLYVVGNETYGRQSCIYVSAGDAMTRAKLDRFLVAEGFKVNSNYNLGKESTEVQVSYFKGVGWNA